MIKRYEVFLKEFVLLLDALVIAGMFLLTYGLRRHLHDFYGLNLIPDRTVFASLGPLDDYVWLLLLALPVWVGMLHLMGAYRELRSKSVIPIVWTIVKAGLLSLMFFGALMYLLKLEYVSRSFVTMFVIISMIGVTTERWLLILVFHVFLRRGYFQRHFLIVGTGRRARAFIRTLRRHEEWGLRLIGLVDQDPQMIGQHIAGAPIVGTLADFPQLLKERVIDEVIFVVPRTWIARIEPAILQCELAGVRTTVSVDLFNIRFARAHPSDFDGIPLISFDTTPMDQWQLATKRLIDILISATALLILLPVFPILALLIRTSSPGPILFRQTRCGLNGRQFTLYKFRSMIADAEAKQSELAHLNELSGPVFKLTRDPRLTPIGRFLRKTSIDELPQLINILKGEMSIVGPRPPIPSEVEKYEPWQRRRLSMRPGLTGYWQVSGRNKIIDFDKWMQLDLEYIDRWSLLLDVKIILKTMPAVMFGIGAK